MTLSSDPALSASASAGLHGARASFALQELPVALPSVLRSPVGASARRVVAAALFPARAAIAFGHASIGVAQLVQPGGPIRLLHLLSSVTADDRPLGQAMQPGGVIDRVLDEDGVVSLLSQSDGVLDRIIARDGFLDRILAKGEAVDRLLEPGGFVERLLSRNGLVDRLLATDGTVDRLIAPGGALDRVLAPDGPLDRLLAEEGAVDRLLAADGTVDRLLAPGGVLDQLVGEDGIVERLGGLIENIDRLGPVLTSLESVVNGMDDSVKSLEGNLDKLAAALAPLSDIAGLVPGTRRRLAARQTSPDATSAPT